MFGSLRELSAVPLAELLKIKGVGNATACGKAGLCDPAHEKS